MVDADSEQNWLLVGIIAGLAFLQGGKRWETWRWCTMNQLLCRLRPDGLQPAARQGQARIEGRKCGQKRAGGRPPQVLHVLYTVLTKPGES
jgi:hypothetical protein